MKPLLFVILILIVICSCNKRNGKIRYNYHKISNVDSAILRNNVHMVKKLRVTYLTIPYYELPPGQEAPKPIPMNEIVETVLYYEAGLLVKQVDSALVNLDSLGSIQYNNGFARSVINFRYDLNKNLIEKEEISTGINDSSLLLESDTVYDRYTYDSHNNLTRHSDTILIKGISNHAVNYYYGYGTEDKIEYVSYFYDTPSDSFTWAFKYDELGNMISDGLYDYVLDKKNNVIKKRPYFFAEDPGFICLYNSRNQMISYSELKMDTVDLNAVVEDEIHRTFSYHENGLINEERIFRKGRLLYSYIYKYD